jgi:CBS domain-containing protein
LLFSDLLAHLTVAAKQEKVMQSNQNTHKETSKQSSTEHRLHLGIGESRLITLPSQAPLLEAVRLMREHNIGDVIITEDMDGELFPAGIVTDRDIALDVLAQCANPESLQVSAVMSRFLVTCPVGTGVFEMIRVMKQEGVSRLPLVSETGALKGIVNAKNLVQLLVAGLHDLARISETQQSNERDVRH